VPDVADIGTGFVAAVEELKALADPPPTAGP
jgi:hypothetical protein